MAATVVGLYLCYRMAAPFVPALAWALALAILLAPLQRRLEPKLRSPGLAAGVLVLLVGVVLVLPAMLVADHLLDGFPDERRLRIPMRPQMRSINLSNAVAVAVYEAWRQSGVAGAAPGAGPD